MQLTNNDILPGGKHHEQLRTSRLEEIAWIVQLQAGLNLHTDRIRKPRKSVALGFSVAQEIELQAMSNPSLPILVKNYPKWNPQIFHLSARDGANYMLIGSAGIRHALIEENYLPRLMK
jgi:hypothetical protein